MKFLILCAQKIKQATEALKLHSRFGAAAFGASQISIPFLN